MIYLFALLQLADIATTHRILKAGGRELNPVLAWLFKRYDHLLVLVLMKAGLVWLVALADIPALTAGLSIAYVAVVAWNVRQMKR